MNSFYVMLTIAIYLIGMLIIGFMVAKKNESSSDFYLGGRKLGPLVTAMSAEASDMSSYLLMGLPGLAYLTGIADVGWTVIGLALGTYFNWLFTAKRLRRYSQVTGSYTLPHFFSARFHDNKSILACLAAVIIIIFFVPYTASGFASCGKLFASMFGIDYTLAMIISSVVIIGYTVAGGFMAASLTDFIQSIVMTIAILFVLIFTTITVGGIDAVKENTNGLQGFMSMFQTHNPADNTATPYGFLQIITTLSWGLGYFGMPHILLRFMAINDEKKLKTSRRVASVWVVITMAVAVLIGIVGNALSANGIIETLEGTAESETIIVVIADFLSKLGPLPALIAGLILAGILASTMSTADSQLLAASSSVSENVLKETFHLNISEKKSMIFARLTVIIIALLGVIIASNPNSSIFGIVSFAWAGFGAAFGPLVICALFWKRTTLAGAISGLCAGGAMVFIWKFAISRLGGVFGVYELLPAFLVALIVIIVVSLLTKAPSKEIVDEFELARSNKELN